MINSNNILKTTLALSLATVAITAQAQLNLPYLTDRWGLNNTGFPQTIEIDHITNFQVQGVQGRDIDLKPEKFKGKRREVIVAVVDTGIDADHPELFSRIVTKDSECKALEQYQACLVSTKKDKSTVKQEDCDKTWLDFSNPLVDQDRNGYPMDCHGWSLLGKTNRLNILGNPDISDIQGHGTHVSGIIASVAENAKILPVQALSISPNEPLKPLSFDSDYTPAEDDSKPVMRGGLSDVVARAIIYAVRNGAEVINLSIGWPEANDSEYLRKVVADAQAKGVIFVAASGNDSTQALLRPCSYPGVICVAAHGPDGSLSHFSNYGSGVDIAAPGTQILSTYPMGTRPKRFRKDFGFEYLHGTSQASPFVAGAVAELLSRGIPTKEIYARLILGSKPIDPKLPMRVGDGLSDVNFDKTQKWILGGRLDIESAASATISPLIVPFKKDRNEVSWDRKSNSFTVKYSFINRGTEIDMSLVSFQAEVMKKSQNSVRPEMMSVEVEANSAQNNAWKNGELRNIIISYQINDVNLVEKTRIPSDLQTKVTIIQGNEKRTAVLDAEIIVPISLLAPQNSKIISIDKLPPKTGLRQDALWMAFDEYLDFSKTVDYLWVNRKDAVFDYLFYKGSDTNLVQSGKLSVSFEKATESLMETQLVKLPNQKYVLGIVRNRSVSAGISVLQLYYLNEKFELIQKTEIANEKVKIPRKIGWQSVGTNFNPTWIELGMDLNKVPSLRDRWNNRNQSERPQTRLYYLGSSGEIKSINDYNGYKFIDLLAPTKEQTMLGRVPVLIGKPQGTEIQPSYIFDFAVAEVYQGKIENFKAIDLHRNLLETKLDPVNSLSIDQRYSGTAWFSQTADRGQRLTVLENTEGRFNYNLIDYKLMSTRGIVDSSLVTWAEFSGQKEAGVFVFTNSELEYHDIRNSSFVTQSAERYTFLGDKTFLALFSRLRVKDQEGSELLPSLYVTEATKLYKGMKLFMPLRDHSGNITEMGSPATLRFKAGNGCEPLGNPTTLSDGTPSLDYLCGSKILRQPLEF